MTRRERMMATLRGESVDRPAVNFYELNGLKEDIHDTDPFNIYTHPSWHPLLQLTAEKTDRIVMQSPSVKNEKQIWVGLSEIKEWDDNGSIFKRKTIKVGKRVLTEETRRDKDVRTVWTTEHLLKDIDDVKAYLELPKFDLESFIDPKPVLDVEEELGETGIVMLGIADPICLAASLFDMGTYTIIALTEKALFRQLLDRFARIIYSKVEAIAKALPGRLWRIVGPEYASAPYLPPALFHEYVVQYDKSIVDMIHHYNGFARIHSHGNLKAILDGIAETGCDGLDPVEPPPQGDVTLEYVREKYGEQMILFGNLEASDIVMLETHEFAEKVKTALDQGTSGYGRGFVLQPSACPYSRILPEKALKNYEKMIELVEAF